ncbi:MAG: hypothetical protein IPM69_12850 [Ignavibacteria bacterium]|nr:hypothetical protein [Ignavibacteria bacterium]
MTNEHIITWLLEGDVSIQYQTYRDLLDTEKLNLRNEIEHEGWGAKFLSLRKQDGHWGQRFYQPKWISTHYTLLDLKNLNISPACKPIKDTINKVMAFEKGKDGGILPRSSDQRCDVCVSGMALNYAAYFGTSQDDLTSIIDFLLAEKMGDGGFNCRSNSTGAVHSSLHSTLSVLEGINEYVRNGNTYRLQELEKVKTESQEFILLHRLFRSDKTGNIISPRFLKLCYPGRWYYDILRALDYFQLANVQYDTRMSDAFEALLKKKTKDGVWKLASKHPGQTHFEMEQAGKPSRWNTLRALRVLKYYNID